MKKFPTMVFVLLLFFILQKGIAFASEVTNDWVWTEPTKGTVNLIDNSATSENLDEVSVSENTIVINEIYPNPDSKSDFKDEFIELYNYGSKDISITNWQIKDKSNSKYTIKENVIIKSKGFYVIDKSVSLNNSGDEITILDSQGQQVDNISYDKNLSKKGFSISRFCDVYELKFCDLIFTSPTPDKENVKTNLDSWTFPDSENILRNTDVFLYSNDDKAQIVYTFHPESSNPDDQFIYKNPIKILNNTEIYFFATKDGISSPVKSQKFEVANPNYQKINYDVNFNEVYLSKDKTNSWIELQNKSGNDLDISSWLITSNLDESSCFDYSETCFVIDSNLEKSGDFYLIDLPDRITQKFNDDQKYTFYLWDIDGNLVDEISFVYSKEMLNRSFSKNNSLNIQDFLLSSVASSIYGWSKESTKGSLNGELTNDTANILAGKDLIITRIMPNPEGKDTRDAEWIEFQNTSEDTLYLQDYHLIINGRVQKQLPDEIIEPNEKTTLTANDLGFTIPNTKTEIKIMNKDQEDVSKVSYEKSEEGKEIIFEKIINANIPILLKSKVVVPTKVSTTSNAKSTSKTNTKGLIDISKVPDLKQISPKDVKPYTKPQIKEEIVEASNTFKNSNPKQDQNNFLLGVLGTAWTFISGLAFIKF